MVFSFFFVGLMDVISIDGFEPEMNNGSIICVLEEENHVRCNLPIC